MSVCVRKINRIRNSIKNLLWIFVRKFNSLKMKIESKSKQILHNHQWNEWKNEINCGTNKKNQNKNKASSFHACEYYWK